jgi:hypothetical protein
MALSRGSKVSQDPTGAKSVPSGGPKVGYGTGQPNDQLDTARDAVPSWDRVGTPDFGRMSADSQFQRNNTQPDPPGGRMLGGFAKSDGGIKNNNVLYGFDGTVDKDNS